MSDQMNENEPKRLLTRRRFIKGGLAIAGALALNTVATRVDNAEKEQASKKRESLKNPDPGLEMRHFALQNFTTQEKELSESSIGYFTKYYLSSSIFPERVITIHNEYKDYIEDAFSVLKSKGFELNPLWKKIMPGLILAESSGDKKTGPGIGLCQLSNPAITDVINLLGKEYEDADPVDPKTNIIFALTYLHRLFNNYNTPDMTIWAYNLGIGTLNKTIRAYSVDQLGEIQIQNIDNTFDDPKKGPSALIKSIHINALRLIQSQAAVDKLGEIAPQTLEEKRFMYFWKVIGAAQAYMEAEQHIFPATAI